MNSQSIDDFIAVGRVEEFPDGDSRVVKVNGKNIALFNVGGKFFAINNVCPHEGGPLAKGKLKGYVGNCPWHDLQFDVRSGFGTDGGGSVRIPAAFCGLVGLKASFGRIPNYPATAVDSLRHTGPLTRTVLDTAIALDVLAGPDERDPSSLPETRNLFSSQIDAGIKGLSLIHI